MSESAYTRLAVRRYARFVETVEESGERPLTIRRPLHEREPLLVQAHGEAALDGAETPDAAVVHEHEALVAEGVAVGVGEIAFGRCTDVCEDERGRRLGCDAREVDAVPCWDRRGEDAGLGA